MSTSHSPLRVLKAQATRIAAMLKAAERGETIAGDSGKFAAARSQPSVKIGVVMDDKFLSIEMTWATISKTSEVGIAEYMLNQMREARDTIQ